MDILALQELLKLVAAANVAIRTVISAFRDNDPQRVLDGLTDEQILARVRDRASTGIVNADALIDRLSTRLPDGDAA